MSCPGSAGILCAKEARWRYPAFYERMGARVIPNPIYDSTETSRAFWDPFAMIHPADAPWSDEAIDLLGSGW